MKNRSEIYFWDNPQYIHRIHQINNHDILGGDLKETKHAGVLSLFWEDNYV
jgi:hypothetical protein